MLGGGFGLTFELVTALAQGPALSPGGFKPPLRRTQQSAELGHPLRTCTEVSTVAKHGHRGPSSAAVCARTLSGPGPDRPWRQDSPPGLGPAYPARRPGPRWPRAARGPPHPGCAASPPFTASNLPFFAASGSGDLRPVPYGDPPGARDAPPENFGHMKPLRLFPGQVPVCPGNPGLLQPLHPPQCPAAILGLPTVAVPPGRLQRPRWRWPSA